MMLICIYAAIFVGEWDNNFFTVSELEAAKQLGLVGLNATEGPALTTAQRIEFMNSLEGNRWLSVALFFFVPRAGALAILCVIAYSITSSNRELLMTA